MLATACHTITCYVCNRLSPYLLAILATACHPIYCTCYFCNRLPHHLLAMFATVHLDRIGSRFLGEGLFIVDKNLVKKKSSKSNNEICEKYKEIIRISKKYRLDI
jgi:hypothetical protein